MGLAPPLHLGAGGGAKELGQRREHKVDGFREPGVAQKIGLVVVCARASTSTNTK